MDHSNSELRRVWRANWLRSIEEFANFDIQLATWLSPDNGNPHYSYVEYIVSYFDDVLLGEPYSARVEEGLLSIEEATAVRELHEKLDRYVEPNGDHDHRAILDDPSWREIVAAARMAQARLAELIFEPAERGSLLRPSEHALVAAGISPAPKS